MAWDGLSLVTLKSYLTLAERAMPSQEVVRATDATVTTLAAINVPVNKVIVCSGFVVARRTGGSSGSTNDGAGYTVEFCANNTSGTAALIGSGTVTALGESQAAWAVTLSASGNDIRVRVAGAANNSVTWKWSGRILTVGE